jgi:hypothetical protein
MIETDKDPDLTMKLEEESSVGKKPFSFSVARNKTANGFKTKSRSESSNGNDNSIIAPLSANEEELMFEKPEKVCEDLPPQIA